MASQRAWARTAEVRGTRRQSQVKWISGTTTLRATETLNQRNTGPGNACQDDVVDDSGMGTGWPQSMSESPAKMATAKPRAANDKITPRG